MTIGAALACTRPGPGGYNAITGAGAFGQGEVGFTMANLGKGMQLGIPIGLFVGAAGGVTARLLRRALTGK